MAAKEAETCPVCEESELQAFDYGPTGATHLHCPECGTAFFAEAEGLVQLEE